jgi:hypothetical protein
MTPKQRARLELEKLCAEYTGDIVRDARKGQRVQIVCVVCNFRRMVAVDHSCGH